MEKESTFSGFYKLTPEERVKKVQEYADLTDEEVQILKNTGGFPIENADRMIENVIGKK